MDNMTVGQSGDRGAMGFLRVVGPVTPLPKRLGISLFPQFFFFQTNQTPFLEPLSQTPHFRGWHLPEALMQEGASCEGLVRIFTES